LCITALGARAILIENQRHFFAAFEFFVVKISVAARPVATIRLI
jgi:hypothetical protein